MNYDQAEILGLRALAHMAENEDILIAYLGLSGISPGALKSAAADPATLPGILASILDYFLQNEKRLIAFCHAENIAPDQLNKARQFLPGGEMIPSTI